LRNSCYENRKIGEIPIPKFEVARPDNKKRTMAKLKKLHMSSNLDDLEKMSIIPDLRSKGMKM